jgi:hypothetical protein
MKTLALAAILVATACNALADEPYPHPYENGGYFDIPLAPTEALRESDPYRHEYLNGGYFDAAGIPAAATASVSLPTHRALR